MIRLVYLVGQMNGEGIYNEQVSLFSKLDEWEGIYNDYVSLFSKLDEWGGHL